MRSTDGHLCSPGGQGHEDAQASERRRTPRVAAEGRVWLSLEDRTAKAWLEDHSEGGLRIKAWAGIKPGEIVYCAAPSLAVCTRARVVHASRGLLRWRVGLEFLATLSDFT